MSLIDEPLEDVGEPLALESDGELVHWMDPRPLRLGPAGITGTALAAFVLGASAAVMVLALTHWLGPRQAVVVERPRGPAVSRRRSYRRGR